MPRSLTVRTPTAAEVRQASQLLSISDSAQQRRRADVVVLYAAGLSATAIAQTLGVHINTIYSDLRAFERDGLAAVNRQQPRGAPLRLSCEQQAEIRRLAEIAPYELGLPYGRWSLSTLRGYLIKRRVVRSISREHLRQVLKKGGSSCDGSAVSSTAAIRSAARS
jgi:transposase